MASEPSSAEQDSINPYAASHVSDSQETPFAPVATESRAYRLQMTWADRRRFLRSVGLLRFGAVAGAIIGFYGLYGLLNGAYSSWWQGDLGSWFKPLMAARWSFVLLKAALGFYACRLQWVLADALAATTGGRTGKMDQWSIIQLKIARLAIVVLAVSALSLAWDWLEFQLISSGHLGM